jgi:MFS family permease
MYVRAEYSRVTQTSKWDTPPGDTATALTARVAPACPTKPRRSWKPWRRRNPVFGAIAGLIALAAAMGIGRFAFTPVLPMMQADAGVTIAAGAWLASANYIGYFIGSLSALVLRVQPATAIRTGLAVIGISTLGMGFQHDVAFWALLRALAGIGSALVLIFVFAWSADQFAHHRHHWFSGIVFAGTGVGVAISGGLCLWLGRANANSDTAWILLGILSSAFAIIVWFAFGTDGASKTVPESGGTLWSLESLRLIGCYGVFGYGYIIPATFLPVMARAIIPDPALFGWAWPIFGSAAVISTFLTARFARRFTHRTIWIGAHFVMAVGIFLPALLPTLSAILIAAILVGGTFMVVPMAAMQEARSIAGAKHSAVLIAAMTSAFALGQIIGPITVGWLVGPQGTNLSASLYIAGGLLVFSALVLIKGRKPRIKIAS